MHYILVRRTAQTEIEATYVEEPDLHFLPGVPCEYKDFQKKSIVDLRSPSVTSVGGTKYMSPEVASHISSGGMSNIFPIPQYQASAVPGYIKTLGDTYKGLYNTTGRGFPDVAAAAENYNIIGRGNGYQFEFGTSASAPTFASVIALVNDRLIAAGKSPMGFLNPFLYSDAGRASLNDITSGNNPGCSTDGFPAVAGWDPVSISNSYTQYRFFDNCGFFTDRSLGWGLRISRRFWPPLWRLE